MKDLIILPTFTRVGSTWFSEIIRHLVKQDHKAKGLHIEHDLGKPLGREGEQTVYVHPPGVYKTHNFTPWDAKRLVDYPGIKLVSVTRNFEDTLVSLLRYLRLRVEQGFENEPSISGFVEQYYETSETEYFNTAVEEHPEYVQEKFRQWRAFCLPVERVPVLDYDLLKTWDTLAVIQYVSDILNLDVSGEDQARTEKEVTRERMLQTFPTGHVHAAHAQRSELFNAFCKSRLAQLDTLS